MENRFFVVVVTVVVCVHFWLQQKIFDKMDFRTTTTTKNWGVKKNKFYLFIYIFVVVVVVVVEKKKERSKLNNYIITKNR